MCGDQALVKARLTDYACVVDRLRNWGLGHVFQMSRSLPVPNIIRLCIARWGKRRTSAGIESILINGWPTVLLTDQFP
jgi:hypothetical protein